LFHQRRGAGVAPHQRIHVHGAPNVLGRWRGE
jgi:hypothetical protein